MKRKLTAALLTVVLIACILIPLSASAGTDADKDLYVEDNETAIGGNISMTIGKEKDLSEYIQYGVRDEDANDRWELVGTVRWTSSNPDTVSVNGQGVATAHKVGTARITATGWDNTGRKHVQTVVVGVSRENEESTANSFEIPEGTWLHLQRLGELHSGAKDIRWASGIPDIASVDLSGLVLANSVGRCTITASYTDENGAEQTVKYLIRVTSAILSEKAQKSAISLRVGDNIDVGELFYPNYQGLSNAFNQLNCTIGDQDVLSASGLSISAKASGTGTVTIYKTEGADETIRHRLTVSVRSSG